MCYRLLPLHVGFCSACMLAFCIVSFRCSCSLLYEIVRYTSLPAARCIHFLTAQFIRTCTKQNHYKYLEHRARSWHEFGNPGRQGVTMALFCAQTKRPRRGYEKNTRSCEQSAKHIVDKAFSSHMFNKVVHVEWVCVACC